MKEKGGENKMMTPYQLAKKAGIRPQHAYNLVRQGLIKAERITCECCGNTALSISDEAAELYLTRRAERQANKS